MYIYNNPKPTLASAWEVLQLENKTLNIIEVTELKDLNPGEYFKLKPESKKVYIPDSGRAFTSSRPVLCSAEEIEQLRPEDGGNRL